MASCAQGVGAAGPSGSEGGVALVPAAASLPPSAGRPRSPLGPDPRLRGLLPPAGRLQEEPAAVAGSGRAAREDAGERGRRPGQVQLTACWAARGLRTCSASARCRRAQSGCGVCFHCCTVTFAQLLRARHVASQGALPHVCVFV